MSDFEEEFEIPATSEVDPAAEFLAKEQVNKTFFSQFNSVSKLTVLAAVLLRLRTKVFVRSAQPLYKFSPCRQSWATSGRTWGSLQLPARRLPSWLIICWLRAR